MLSAYHEPSATVLKDWEFCPAPPTMDLHFMEEKQTERRHVRESGPVDIVAPERSGFPALHTYTVGKLIEITPKVFSGQI